MRKARIRGARLLIDLNHILLFIATVSPVLLLARIARLRNTRNRGWSLAALTVLLVCGLAWFFLPAVAGFVGGTFWALLLLAPALADRKIEDLLLARHFGSAGRVAVVRQLLHPWNDSPFQPRLLRSLALAASGRLDLALDQLACERAAASPAGRHATALTFALTENWSGLVEWCRRDLAVTANPAVYSLYLRALGEIGALDNLVFELSAPREPSLTGGAPSSYNLALALAFGGRSGDLVKLMSHRLGRMSPESQQFWLATAELAEGNLVAGRARLESIRSRTRDAIMRRAIERRLSVPPMLARLSVARTTLLARLVTGMSGPSQLTVRRQASAPAVWTLIFLNVAMFGVELILGGATNARTLHQLGALEPEAVVSGHEYWRLLTALFLHYGVLHLGFNLYALYLLGPELERLIGALKFTLGYLLAGLGSSAGVVILRMLNLTNSDLLVGASGCVMGVIGISAGLLLRHRQSPLAGRRLRHLIVIVALQTAFDLSTPQVSLAAHLSGFITGVVIGLTFALPRRAAHIQKSLEISGP